jgi:RNA polymerase sigma-70 factor (ECF subfamily)
LFHGPRSGAAGRPKQSAVRGALILQRSGWVPDPMSSVSERDLVERCRQGDEGAFRELVDKYKDLVFALIARTVQDRSRAEDLSQEVFLRIHRGLPYFRGEARLSTWIYRIVANVCAQEHAAPARSTLSLDDERTSNRVTTGSHDPRFGDLEVRDRLEKAIARLPANYRLLIAAHYLDGVRYEDLAEALQLPLGTVKTQLYRAKQQLRRLLETELK